MVLKPGVTGERGFRMGYLEGMLTRPAGPVELLFSAER